MSGNIKVVVRCRPLNTRELTRGAKPLIRIEGNQTILDPPDPDGTDKAAHAKATERKTMSFAFDKSYNSYVDKSHPDYASQEMLYNDLGAELLQHSFEGFNTCIFAYGQTGSGKSYSMMGYGADKGIIPLTCEQLFEQIKEKTGKDANLTCNVEVSYIEIYNEKVRDLLNPKNKGNLKVREHPSLGPYVEDLSKLAVQNFEDIEHLMDEGNKARTVASTNMNATSSRSHAVFTLVLTQKRRDVETNLETEKVSRISLVDLAGSERANSTGATGQRLKEGANINKSLTTLGKVIAALAHASMSEASSKGKKKGALDFVPYRDSILTWLLKDSLGGNSKTAMIAAISPADYDETLSTLRYADQAKKIKNKAVVNEDPNAKLIRELKEELEMLRTRVGGGSGGMENESTWDPTVPPEKQVVRYQTKTGEIRTVTKAELQEQLEQSEKIMASLNESWEEKMVKTQLIQKEREHALEELGITVEKNHVGVHTPKKLPHLVNLNEDPLMSECLIYQIKPGKTVVGSLEGSPNAHIRLSGSNILSEHCYFENADGVVTIHAMPDSMTMVNGVRVSVDKPRRLKSGYRVIMGDFHIFRFNHPEEVRKARDKVRSTLAMSTKAEDLKGPGTPGTPAQDGQAEQTEAATRPDSPISTASAADVDWTYARRELALAKLNGQDVNFDKLNEEDLDKLFDDISRARTSRKGGSGRPESRMSYFDDGMSESTNSYARPFSTSTDDTGLSTLQMGSSEASFGDPLRSSVAGTPAGTLSHKEAEDLKAKVKQYEERFKRIAGGVPGSVAELEEKTVYTEEQRRLIDWVLSKWRTHTRVGMAEQVLSNAVLIKEANVISKELNKGTTYQFTVVEEGPLSNPSSALEAISGLTEFDDVADPALAKCPKPCIGIKVIDKRNTTLYTWSIDKLEQRLQKMRNLYTFIDRPEYSRHFNWEDPFYESPSPGFVFVGNALVTLSPLARHITTKHVVPILSRHNGEAMGSCRVEVKFVSLSSPAKANGKFTNGTSSPASSADWRPELPEGHKLGLSITVDSVTGFTPDRFASIHTQVRLSALTGPTIASEDVFPSSPVEIEKGAALSDLKLRRTVSFVITPEIAAHIKTGFAPIEFFARLKPLYLDQLAQWDESREMPKGKTMAKGPAANGRAANGHAVVSPSAGRLSEAELVTEEKHDVMAFVQICELNEKGEYAPVNVLAQNALDPGSFWLRQGLQRKVVLKLSHSSGRQFPWTRVRKVELGNVRLLDPKGRIHDSTLHDPVQLQVPNRQQVIDFANDGTSSLDLWAWWDSSIHDSIFLNRTTTSNHRVLLQMTWQVEVETCAESVTFHMDLALTIHSRDSRPPNKLVALMTSSRTLSKTSALFSVRLSPPLTKRTKELWRLDTGSKYVRGEEALGVWKPRGVSLVQDHAQLVRREQKLAEVEGVKAILKVINPASPSRKPEREERDDEEILKKAIALWQRSVADAKQIQLSQEPIDEPSPAPIPAATSAAPSAGPTKFTSEVKIIPRTDNVAKKGWLSMPIEPFSDRWMRQWFVLRRPYLYVYESSSEVEEVTAMNLSAVRVEHNPAVEDMLGRNHVFCLYTHNNSYFIQAPSQKEREAWQNCIAAFVRA